MIGASAGSGIGLTLGVRINVWPQRRLRDFPDAAPGELIAPSAPASRYGGDDERGWSRCHQWPTLNAEYVVPLRIDWIKRSAERISQEVAQDGAAHAVWLVGRTNDRDLTRCKGSRVVDAGISIQLPSTP